MVAVAAVVVVVAAAVFVVAAAAVAAAVASVAVAAALAVMNEEQAPWVSSTSFDLVSEPLMSEAAVIETGFSVLAPFHSVL